MATTEQDVLSRNKGARAIVPRHAQWRRPRAGLGLLRRGLDLDRVCGRHPRRGCGPGRAIIDEFLTPVRGLFEPGNPKVEVKRVVAEGSSVVVEAEGHGRFLNGSPYDNVYCFVLDDRGREDPIDS